MKTVILQVLVHDIFLTKQFVNSAGNKVEDLNIIKSLCGVQKGLHVHLISVSRNGQFIQLIFQNIQHTGINKILNKKTSPTINLHQLLKYQDKKLKKIFEKMTLSNLIALIQILINGIKVYLKQKE